MKNNHSTTEQKAEKKAFLVVPNISVSKAAEEIGRNPYVDWVVVVLLSFFVGLILVAGGGFLFYTVSKAHDQDGAAAAATDASDIFNTKQLSTLIQNLNAKTSMTSEANKGYAGVADPSY